MLLLTERTRRIQRHYDRQAARYDRSFGGLEEQVTRWRRRLWERVPPGRILEVGIGTGNNFPFYEADGRSFVGVELSAGMLTLARSRAEELGTPVALVRADVQHLPFQDGTFDAVVASLIFCCVPDPIRGLREVARVCRPEGSVVLLEHGRTSGLLGLLLDAVDPLVAWLGQGEHLNRRTEELVRAAGLAIERVETFFGGIVKLVTALPSPHN